LPQPNSNPHGRLPWKCTRRVVRKSREAAVCMGVYGWRWNADLAAGCARRHQAGALHRKEHSGIWPVWALRTGFSPSTTKAVGPFGVRETLASLLSCFLVYADRKPRTFIRVRPGFPCERLGGKAISGYTGDSASCRCRVSIHAPIALPEETPV